MFGGGDIVWDLEVLLVFDVFDMMFWFVFEGNFGVVVIIWCVWDF